MSLYIRYNYHGIRNAAVGLALVEKVMIFWFSQYVGNLLTSSAIVRY